jgi:type IV secretory pathway VirB3-like protein
MALHDHSDVLYVAITRPTMKMGVPFEGLSINFIISYCAYFFVGHANLMSYKGVISLLCFPVMHCIMRVGIAHDPNMFRLVRLWTETRALQPRLNSVLWPMPWWPARKPDELPSGGL